MRNLKDIGKAPDVILADADLVVLIMPNEGKGFGSLVFMEGAPAPISTSLTPDEVRNRLKSNVVGLN
jgi:hypothetical protein